MILLVCCTIGLECGKFVHMEDLPAVHVLFGRRVRDLRKLKGISQEELACRAELHRTYIGMIERAEKNISLRNIQKISKALEVSMHELLNFECI